jgi:glycosyltransferase involved in cell wall biosynthesis
VTALAEALGTSGVDAHVVILTRAGPLAERLALAAIPFSELGLERPRAGSRHPRWLADAVGGAGEDGVILPGSGFLAPILRLGGYRGRIVAVEHGSLLHGRRFQRRSRLVDKVDRLLGAMSVDIHVAVSDVVGRRLPHGAVVTIPNGVDLELYRPQSLRRSDLTFVIGCVSRLSPGKGVEDVLAAARSAISQGAQLRIAGDGPERGKLEQHADDLGISDGVSFEGWISGAGEVATFWSGCDVAIAAPNALVESFGLSAVEAMACGKPVVATRAGGLAEVIVHGRTGLLAEPGDTAALAKDLLAYMNDDSLVASHGAAARIRCEQRYDIRRCAAGYADLFRSRKLGSLRGTSYLAFVARQGDAPMR